MGNSDLYLVLKVCYLSLTKVLCFFPGYSKSITKCVVHEENFKLSHLVLSMQKFGVYSKKKLKNPVMCEDSKASSCQRDNQQIKQIIPSKTNYWFFDAILGAIASKIILPVPIRSWYEFKFWVPHHAMTTSDRWWRGLPSKIGEVLLTIFRDAFFCFIKFDGKYLKNFRVFCVEKKSLEIEKAYMICNLVVCITHQNISTISYLINLTENFS